MEERVLEMVSQMSLTWMMMTLMKMKEQLRQRGNCDRRPNSVFSEEEYLESLRELVESCSAILAEESVRAWI